MKNFMIMAAAAMMTITAVARDGRPVATTLRQHEAPSKKVLALDKIDLQAESHKAGSYKLSKSIMLPKEGLTAHFGKSQKHQQIQQPAVAPRLAAPKAQAKAEALRNLKHLHSMQNVPAEVIDAKGVADSYIGHGYMVTALTEEGEIADVEPMSWLMKTLTVNDEQYGEVSFMIDMIPNQLQEIGIPYVALQYTVIGNKLIVPAQPFDAVRDNNGQTVYLWMLGNTNEDGSIEFTIGQDGQLTCKENIVYYAVNPSSTELNWEYLMPLEIFNAPQYDVDLYETMASYTGIGVNYGERGAWVMSLGNDVNEYGESVPSVRQLLPTIDLRTPVEFTVENDSIVIVPQQVGELSNQMGQVVYYLFVLDGDTEDGTIKLAIDANGTISKQNSTLMIGACKTPYFSLESYAGAYDVYTQVNYFGGSESIPYFPEYEADVAMLFPSMTVEGYGYTKNLELAPAYGEFTYVNYTPEKDVNTNWEMKTTTGMIWASCQERDLTVTLDPKYRYLSPTLTVSNGDRSGSFAWGTFSSDEVELNAGGVVGEFLSGDDALWCTADIDRGITRGEEIATPASANANGYDLASLILYQGKVPAGSTLTFSDLNILVYSYAGAPADLVCKIVKAHRDAAGNLELGDVIAESSDAKFVPMMEAYYAQQGRKTPYATLQFTDFYRYDPDEMTISLEGGVYVSCEFAVVLEGYNNGSFTCIPIEESDANLYSMPSIYCTMAGHEDELLRFRHCAKVFVGFNNAVYGYMRPMNGASNFIEADVNGGTYTLTIESMLSNTGGVPRIFLDEFSDEYATIEDLPTWFTIDEVNPLFDETHSQFDLAVTVEPLPAGEVGRYVSIPLCQEGARMNLRIGQGDLTSIQSVKVDNAKLNAAYNLYGMPVQVGYKGVQISKGVKSICK